MCSRSHSSGAASGPLGEEQHRPDAAELPPEAPQLHERADRVGDGEVGARERVGGRGRDGTRSRSWRDQARARSASAQSANAIDAKAL